MPIRLAQGGRGAGRHRMYRHASHVLDVTAHLPFGDGDTCELGAVSLDPFARLGRLGLGLGLGLGVGVGLGLGLGLGWA